ncbi:MAG: tetratricopeptide repeat protein [Kiritimatiellales bacterium]
MKKLLLLITCALLLSGCGKNGAQLDAADENDPHVRQGLDLVQLKNWDGAVKQFDTALAKKPELARADLELAMIYQQKKNYARAIYHYERYLEKRPDTEKRALIQEWIKQAKVSLAGEIGGTGSDLSEQLVRLTRENNMLRQQLEAFQGKTAAAPAVANVKTILTDAPLPRPVAAPPVVTQTVEKVQSVPAPKPARTYTVRSGDTLTRIAGSIYGDASLWKKIYEANREQMKNESDIKVGQTLVIPDPGN